MTRKSIAVASSVARAASRSSDSDTTAASQAESPLSQTGAHEHLGHRFEQVALRAPPSSSSERLRMSHPGHAAEREADRLARQVAGHAPSAEPAGPTAPAVPVAAPISSSLQTEVLSAASGGSVLAKGPRAHLEQELGSDLGHVRLHTGADADRLTRSVRARAFTVRQHVFFRQGTFAPHTPQGQALLAHEVVHTLQHRGGVSGPGRLPVSPAPAADLHRVLDPEEEKKLAEINARLGVIDQEINALKYRPKQLKEKEHASERAQLMTLRSKFEAKKLQPSPEQQALDEERARQEQARRREEQQRQDEALAKKKAELAPHMAAVAKSAKTIRGLYDKARADWKEHPAPAAAANPKKFLALLQAADQQAVQALTQTDKITLDSELAQAQALEASTQKLEAEAQANYVAWDAALKAEIQNANLQNQDDKFKAADAIHRGYVAGASCTLDHTFVSKDDVNGGFCGEYRMKGKAWVIHVHRDSKGVWRKAHVKTRGDMSKGNSVDLNISGMGSAKAALDSLGIHATDTTR